MAFDTVQHFRDAMVKAHIIELTKTSAGPGGTTRTQALYRNGPYPPAPAGLPPAVAGVALGRADGPPIRTLGAGKKWVLGRNELLGQVSNAGTGMLYDRLLHTGGLSGIVTTAQTVNSVALPARAGGGDGVEVWVEIHTATGATLVTVTVSYTNEAGVAGRTGTSSIGAGSQAAGLLFSPLALQAGDKGVRSIQSATLSASTLTAGNWGFTFRKRLCDLTLFAARWEPKDLDWIGSALPPVDQDACLEVISVNINNAAHAISGKLYLAEVDV